MKTLALPLLTLLVSASAFAAIPSEDKVACGMHTNELVDTLRQKFVPLAQNRMIQSIAHAYAGLGIQLDGTQLQVTTATAELSPNPWGISAALEMKIDAGADSAVFTGNAKANVSQDNELNIIVDRQNEYDSIGRLRSTRLVCSLRARDYSWLLLVKNKATGITVEQANFSGDVSAEVVLP